MTEADYLEIVKPFDVCSDKRKVCLECPEADRQKCAELFSIIVEKSKYVYKETGGLQSAPPVYPVCGPAKKYL